MRISAELRDHEAAGSLAEELPYWGWLEDGRTCLTRSGELIAAGRLAPAVVDGRSPEQIDRVLGRWQRLLSGLDSDTRLYFYMLRRPASPEAADADGSGIVAVSQRKRSAFLAGRVQRLEAYLVWSHDPRLRTVADGPTSGRASRLMQWWKRRRGGAPTYLRSSGGGGASSGLAASRWSRSPRPERRRGPAASWPARAVTRSPRNAALGACRALPRLRRWWWNRSAPAGGIRGKPANGWRA